MIDTDRVAYFAIVALLEATDAFGAVRLDEPRAAAAIGIGPSPLAIVTPGTWTATPTDDPSTDLRRSTYRVTILVREAGPSERFAQLDRLEGLARAVLDRSVLGVDCIPSLSTLERGECRPTATDGEAIGVLHGTFSRLISASSNPGSAPSGDDPPDSSNPPDPVPLP